MTTLSRNLRPIYDYELRIGNEVERRDMPAGSETPLAIIFKRPLHFAEISRDLILSPEVERWENHDSHYPLEAGFGCRVTRHAIAGPLR